jgi:glycosyltransferase involved in cell wall biosynthesis
LHLLGLRSDVAAVLASADIFVLPSLSEGLPLALLEAMFSGCPIVASDVGDVGVALAQGNAGLLVEPGNAAALAAALDALLSDPQRAAELGERAARRAAEKYDVSRMVRTYAALYEELLTQGASARAATLTAASRSLPSKSEV